MCLRGLRTFKQVDGGVRVGMKAWIGVGAGKGGTSRKFLLDILLLSGTKANEHS